MTIVSIPKPLRDRLGEEATDSLVQIFKEQEAAQKDHLFEILEDRFAKRLVETEGRLRDEMHQGFLGIQKQFGEVQKQFGEIQKQITSQTRWLIALIAFLGIAIKLLDLLFHS